MATLAPESTRKFEQDWLTGRLADILKALMQFTGAKAGWVGLVQTNGQLSFPAVLGDFAKEWLTKQQGLDSQWGFTFREDTATLVNDVPPVPGFSEPAINSILSCPIFQEGK